MLNTELIKKAQDIGITTIGQMAIWLKAIHQKQNINLLT